MATIREIAELAGVSIATVSNVLNNKPGVKQETAEMVLYHSEEKNMFQQEAQTVETVVVELV